MEVASDEGRCDGGKDGDDDHAAGLFLFLRRARSRCTAAIGSLNDPALMT